MTTKYKPNFLKKCLIFDCSHFYKEKYVYHNLVWQKVTFVFLCSFCSVTMVKTLKTQKEWKLCK